jgi:membrane dipeptidase
VGVQVFALFTAPKFAPHHSHARALALLRAFQAEVAAHRDDLAAVTSVAEIHRTLEAGRLAAVLSIENGDAIEDDPGRLEAFYEAGVRMFSLTWNPSNRLADGAFGDRHGGLTPFGRQVVRRLQELGMILDVSHLSERSFWDAVEISRGPLIASHSNAASRTPHPRNLSDAQIRALAGRGGVIGINFYPDFLGGASVARVVQHIDHLVSIGGVGCVAMGSDFDGISRAPRGLENPSKFPALCHILAGHGYQPEEIARMMGENALRVFQSVWGR